MLSRAWSRDWLLHADVFELSPVGSRAELSPVGIRVECARSVAQ